VKENVMKMVKNKLPEELAPEMSKLLETCIDDNRKTENSYYHMFDSKSKFSHLFYAAMEDSDLKIEDCSGYEPLINCVKKSFVEVRKMAN